MGVRKCLTVKIKNSVLANFRTSTSTEVNTIWLGLSNDWTLVQTLIKNCTNNKICWKIDCNPYKKTIHKKDVSNLTVSATACCILTKNLLPQDATRCSRSSAFVVCQSEQQF